MQSWWQTHFLPFFVVGDGNSSKTLQALTQRVKRQENMLHRCKEAIQLHKERSAQLTHEKEALQEQLDERLQELEKMKVSVLNKAYLTISFHGKQPLHFIN